MSEKQNSENMAIVQYRTASINAYELLHIMCPQAYTTLHIHTTQVYTTYTLHTLPVSDLPQ